MKLGIGIDIIEIKRIEIAIEKHKNFLIRNFTEKEIGYFKTCPRKMPQTVAGHFAAKEAFSKSLGTGFRSFSLIDVEILHDKNNKPFLLLKNKVQKCSLSISHTKDNALAIVIHKRKFLFSEFIKAFKSIF